MSRQNKVNPAHYTQRGRLTQDDVARELVRQRSIGSQHTWQPVKKNALPSLPFKNDDADRGAETSEHNEKQAASPSRGKAKPTERMTGRPSAKTAARARAKQSETAKTSTVNADTSAGKKTSDVGRVPRLVRHSLGEGGSGPGATGKNTATRTVRKAVLARNVGGPALKPLRAKNLRKG